MLYIPLHYHEHFGKYLVAKVATVISLQIIIETLQSQVNTAGFVLEAPSFAIKSFASSIRKHLAM